MGFKIISCFNFLLLGTLLFFGPCCHAFISKVIRTIEEVEKNLASEMAVRIPGAQVVMADYDLIRQDFPHLRKASDRQIDSWLLSETGFLAETQTKQAIVNSPIAHSEEKKKSFRPHDYGRGLVFEVEGGLIDGKGFGALSPSQENHSNGLATLGEMIREFLFEKLIQHIFAHAGGTYRTVGTYAVIDWGFDVVHADGNRSRAGAVLRQAHSRARGYYSLFATTRTQRIETILRKYGITSAGAYRRADREYDRLNIQGTKMGEIIDFGAFLVVDHFTYPARTFDKQFELFSRGWKSPRPDFQIPLKVWGSTVTGVEDPLKDNVWNWSHELADSWSRGTADRTSFNRHFMNLMGPIFEKFPLSPATGKCHGFHR